MPTILVYTDSSDLHADVVCQRLTEASVGFVRLDTDRLPAEQGVTATLGKAGWSAALRDHRTDKSLDDITSVWVRRPGRYFGGVEMDASAKAFADNEWDHLLGGLWQNFEVHWVSHPTAIRQASWKLEQLRRAESIGMSVPRSLATNDPEAAQRFVRECGGQALYKPLAGALPAPAAVAGVTTSQTIRSRLVAATELTEEVVRPTPLLLQEYVSKDIELRITVVGDDVFVAGIHSQVHPRTATDYRDFSVPVPYTREPVDEELAQQCLVMLRSYGLRFGAFDVIRTPDGEHVFLEVNPVGQFLFVEQLVPSLRITDALIAEIAGPR